MEKHETAKDFIVTGFRSWQLLKPEEQEDIRNRFYSSIMDCLLWKYDPTKDVWIHD